MNEDNGYSLIMELVHLAKAGKPYKTTLAELKPYIEAFPRIAELVNALAKNLTAD